LSSGTSRNIKLKCTGILMKYSEDEVRRRVKILLAAQKALIGAITPQLRAVNLFWDMKRIDLYFIYDGEISEYDQEESECAATEVLTYFTDGKFETHHITCDYPQEIPLPGNEVVFRRHEVY
jgi:hypothetical protein